MKKIIHQITLIYFILLGLTLSSQISKKLWGMENLGEINDLKYTNDSNVLISTKKGILNLFDLNTKDFIVKKNYIYEKPLKLETTETCNLISLLNN